MGFLSIWEMDSNHRYFISEVGQIVSIVSIVSQKAGFFVLDNNLSDSKKTAKIPIPRSEIPPKSCFGLFEILNIGGTYHTPPVVDLS